MKHHEGSRVVPNVAEQEQRMESLLHAAASFLPEHTMPDSLVSNALSRLGGDAKAARRPVFSFAAGGAILAACCVGAMTLIVAHRGDVQIRIAIARRANGDTSRTKSVVVVAERKPPTRAQLFARSLPIRVPHERHRRRTGHSTVAMTPPAKIRASSPKSLTLPSHPQIATNAMPPPQSGWTNEEVQETNYMLVSPGIVTEGSGNSEHATPVLVPLPINANSVVDDSDAFTSNPTANSQ